MSTRPVARIPGTATRSVDLFLLPVQAKWLVAPSPALMPMPNARLYIVSRWPECQPLSQSASFPLCVHFIQVQLRYAGNAAFTLMLSPVASAALLGLLEFFPPLTYFWLCALHSFAFFSSSVLVSFLSTCLFSFYLIILFLHSFPSLIYCSASGLLTKYIFYAVDPSYYLSCGVTHVLVRLADRATLAVRYWVMCRHSYNKSLSWFKEISFPTYPYKCKVIFISSIPRNLLLIYKILWKFQIWYL